MPRMHINVGVENLDRSIDFYHSLFGVEPTVRKPDYAKWILEDPAVNFAISRSATGQGIDHVGVQFDSMAGLDELRDRLQASGTDALVQDAAECCYAKSDKSWIRDPDGVVWEAFVTHEQRETYGADRGPIEFDRSEATGRCCA